MTRRVGLLILVAVALLAMLPAAQASITMVGSPRPGGSVVVTFGAERLRGWFRYDRSVFGAGRRRTTGRPPRNFEPPVFRKLDPWSDSGNNDTSDVWDCHRPARDDGREQALVFDLYMMGTDPNSAVRFRFLCVSTRKDGWWPEIRSRPMWCATLMPTRAGALVNWLSYWRSHLRAGGKSCLSLRCISADDAKPSIRRSIVRATRTASSWVRCWAGLGYRDRPQATCGAEARLRRRLLRTASTG